MKIGFDNDLYLQKQTKHIEERIAEFGGKLYLEFGGKLFDDYHAARVLPGFAPDAKTQVLKKLSDKAEIVIVINANDIEEGKIRADLGPAPHRRFQRAGRICGQRLYNPFYRSDGGHSL